MGEKNVLLKAKDGKALSTRFDEWNPFLTLRSEMDRVFDDFFREFGTEPFFGPTGTFQPSIDVSDTDKEIKIAAELPGMDEKDIELSLTRDSLTIKGEKKAEKEQKEKNYHRVERTYGAFSRTIALPVEVNTDKADAVYRNGVLMVTLPKTEKAIKETRKIPIKARKNSA